MRGSAAAIKAECARGLRVAARRTRSAPAAAALAHLSLGPRVPLAGPRLLAPVVAALAHPPARSAFLPSPLCRPGGPWAPCGALGPFPASSGLGASGLRAAAAALAACSSGLCLPAGVRCCGPSGGSGCGPRCPVSSSARPPSRRAPCGGRGSGSPGFRWPGGRASPWSAWSASRSRSLRPSGSPKIDRLSQK